MAAIIKPLNLTASGRAELPQPVILCRPNLATENDAISLNVPLAQKLALLKPSRRTMRLEQCFRQVIDSLPENPTIQDFDVLFNPDYEVDVLRIMASVGKSKPFQVIWPGKYEDGRLIYAEEGYRDYKVFDMSKYDVTVVV